MPRGRLVPTALVAVVCLVSLLAYRPAAAQAANDYPGGNAVRPVTSVEGTSPGALGVPQITFLAAWREWLVNRLHDLDRSLILPHVGRRPNVTSVPRRGALTMVRGSR